MIKSLYFVKGFYYNHKLGIYQIINEALFADSEIAAKTEALQFFRKLGKGKAKIYNVESMFDETYSDEMF